jgi:hypothetical protein
VNQAERVLAGITCIGQINVSNSPYFVLVRFSSKTKVLKIPTGLGVKANKLLSRLMERGLEET